MQQIFNVFYIYYSSAAEWESEISHTGELFYIESAAESIVDGQSLYNEADHDCQPELTRRRSTRAGKLMRLIRRKESKRWSMRNKKNYSNATSNNLINSGKEGSATKEVTFRDFQVNMLLLL